jgi:hypothetical protein
VDAHNDSSNQLPPVTPVAKPQVAKIKPQKAPYGAPTILTSKVDPKPPDIDPQNHLKIKPSYLIRIALCCLCLGILCNQWVLTGLFSSDGQLEFTTRAQIWFLDIGLILLGLCLIWYSRWGSAVGALRYWQQNYPRTTASAFGLGMAVVLLVSIEVFFYVLNRITADNSRVWESTLRFVKTEPLGYKNPPNTTRAVEKMSLNGREIFNATYSTDGYSRRITPFKNAGRAEKFALFFGCSYTFGEGVQNEETLPSRVGELAPRYRPYNYGAIGYGPQHVMIKLQDPNLRQEIEENEGILIYMYIHDHVYRVIGTINHHGREMPYYVLDSNGDLQRKGNMVSGRPGLALWYWFIRKSQMAQFFQLGFDSRIEEYDIKRTAKIIIEARNAFSRFFSRSEFYVLVYPNPASRSAGSLAVREKLLMHLKEANVHYLDYSELFNPDPSQGLRIESDPHPTPKAYRLLAERLTRDLGIGEVTSR